MNALLLYLAAVADDGDWQNDHLTHLPVIIRPLIEFIGHMLALILGT